MKLDNLQDHEPILLAFEEAWARGEDPSPAIFAEKAGKPVCIELVAELVMIDFEHRSRRGIGASLDYYFSQHPELKQDPEILEELVDHEFRLRRKFGNYPTLAEIDSRFGDDSTAKEIWRRIAESDDGPTLQVAHIPTGTVIGSYVIGKAIGNGAFATVYSAIDTRLNRRVAIKLLMQSSDTRPEIRMRMEREAKAIASVNHPCIVPIYENGNYLSHDFIVTRYVEGVTLAQHLRNDQLSVTESVNLIRQLASALCVVHKLGVVHRDIKPANIMLEDGTPQLVDFGLAAFDDASNLLTREGDIVGTPAYMPPEQADGKAIKADSRSDIYSLGATLYRLVCGSVPFEGSTSEVISKVLKTEPSIPSAAAQHLGRDLSIIILKCLQKTPAARYQTASELEADLQRYQSGEPIHARPVGLIARIRKWAKRRPAVAALTFATIAAVGVLVYQKGQLEQVVTERNSAELSNQSTQRALRASATESGVLALERGQIDDAIAHLQQGLELDGKDRVHNLLKLVEANLMKGDTDSALHWWYEVQGDHSVERHSGNLPGDSSQGMILIWKAELAMAGVTDLGSSLELMNEARQLALPDAERHYVDGLLAAGTLEALEELQAAIEVDPSHQRARLTQINAQLSLAMIEEATGNLHVARQMYPESADYILLEGLLESISSNPEDAIQRLQFINLESTQQAEWESFYRLIASTVSNPLFLNGMGEFNSAQLASVIELLSLKFQALQCPRKWNLPFVTVAQFEDLQHQLPKLLEGDPETGILLLDAIVQVHPESSLILALGSLRLSLCTGLPANAEQEIPQLESAREDYRLALTRPGLLKHDDQIAWKAIFTISTVLGRLMNHDVDNNLAQLFEATTRVQTTSITSASRARTFAILNLTHDKNIEADRWIDRWVSLTPESQPSRQDAIWHKAVVSKRLKKWVDTIEWCDKLISLNSDFPNVKALRDNATSELRKVLAD